MLARLILALLLAAFALPTMASATSMAGCHETPAATMSAMHHGGRNDPTPVQPDRVAPHICIGCIPAPDASGSRITTRIVPRRALFGGVIARLDPGLADPPVLPPPRTA